MQEILPLRNNEDVRALFSLKRPCKDCPFRRDVESYLHPAWAERMVRELDEGTPFFCHNFSTVPGYHVTDRRARYCAGHQLWALAQDRLPQTNVLAHALGLWSPTQLDAGAVPVIGSAQELLEHHGGGCQAQPEQQQVGVRL